MVMNKLETIKSKASELCRQLDEIIKTIPSYYIERLDEITKILALQNRVAALSNYRVADALMDTIKQIAYTESESNYEIICMYLEQAIEDLTSGMDATEMLWKYDSILVDKWRGRRAKVILVDDQAPMWKEYFEQIDKE